MRSKTRFHPRNAGLIDMPYKQRLYKRRADLPDAIRRVIDRMPIENTAPSRLALADAVYFNKYDDVLSEEDWTYLHKVRAAIRLEENAKAYNRADF